MRVSISNIAWDARQDEAIAKMLYKYELDAIDIAPGKYFPEPASTSEQSIAHVKKQWSDRGIEIVGMQSLLFGTTGLNMFGPVQSQKAMLAHLERICYIGASLGASRLVFGSPKNRDRSGLNAEVAFDMAVNFFGRLADIAQSHGVIICLEPNPTCYGANFMTTSAETAAIVERVAHRAVKMQFDTGALIINKEDADAVLSNWAHLIGHIHASDRNLIPLNDGEVDHASIARSVQKSLPDHIVTIEMLTPADDHSGHAIAAALDLAVKAYRSQFNQKTNGYKQ